MQKVKSLTKLVYILPILWALVIRCSIGLFPHSGKEKPQIYGDFEAQRHWMEITVNLPLREWYFNSSKNDLNYWGLDYPPLTAYHSYLLGLVTKTINSNWTALFKSRGSETKELASLMRIFVLLTDICLYLPALSYYYFIAFPKLYNKVIDLDLLLCGLFFPGIILIDYGHFQYNGASLGLFIVSSIFLMKNRNILGSIFFCLALSYKQMELYHALPIFFLILGKCIHSNGFLRELLKISATVISTFSLVFLPFIIGSSGVGAITQIFRRLFPISRGLFEDKVSNFWCAISVVFKFKHYDSSTIFMVCAICTLMGSLMSCLCVLANPRNKTKYLYASLVVSLSFFLFSYQVHEKSILIPATSALLLIPFEPFWANWFLYLATLSMWPLLLKDQLILAMVVCCGIFVVFFTKQIIRAKKLEKILFFLFNIGYFTILLLSWFMEPPTKYPFLYPLLTSQWCCATFLLHFLYFNYRILIVN